MQLKMEPAGLVPPPAHVPSKEPTVAPSDRTISYSIFGDVRSAPNAAQALVDVLRSLAARDPSRLPWLLMRCALPSAAMSPVAAPRLTRGGPISHGRLSSRQVG
jgi:hypothetical protein